MALIDDLKLRLRISNSAYNSEITDLINEAKSDLALVGLINVDETDPLIKRAISTYVKANFGWNNPDAEKLQQSYEAIRNHLSLSVDYAFYAVTFTVTDSSTTDPIRMAEVSFNGVVKTTDESGVATLYVHAGSNYKYTVIADGYEPDDDEENLLDVSASQTVAISLVVV